MTKVIRVRAAMMVEVRMISILGVLSGDTSDSDDSGLCY